MTRQGSRGIRSTESNAFARSGSSPPLTAALRSSGSTDGALATATKASSGIGHTRWATHGAVTESNAHPHADESGRFQIVLNGIIENHLELRERLEEHGVSCVSDTDAEVVAHLIALNYSGDLVAAVRESLSSLEGHYALVALSAEDPDTLVGVRHECPLVVGSGNGEQFIASSISAFLHRTRDVAVLHDGEIAVLRPDEITVFDLGGLPHRPPITRVDWDDDRCEKDGFETFMLKEIHEQGAAVADTLTHWKTTTRSVIGEVLDRRRIADVTRIIIVGCGTSYHAGLAGRLAIERWLRIPVEVDVASEFRYRDPILDERALVIGITQSGETADTLAAMRLARAQGATVIAVTNAAGSQATREANAVIFTRAGLEMGVAATKTFAAQVAVLYAFALHIGEVTGELAADELAARRSDLDALPAQIDSVVQSVDGQTREPRGAIRVESVLPVSPTARRVRRRTRGRPQAQGDLIRADGRLCRRRDETWADRTAGR